LFWLLLPCAGLDRLAVRQLNPLSHRWIAISQKLVERKQEPGAFHPPLALFKMGEKER
jgi:hypothetical protein